MPTYTSPRPVADHATWAPGTSCPMATRDLYNFPIAASTPHDWYRPRIFVSGCENPANAGSGSSSTGGGSFLYDPAADAWEDIPHFIGMDPSYSVAGTYSHGAATFHPVGPTGTATAGSASGITIDKYLAGNLAVGARIRITGGTGAGQSRTITASSASTRSASYLPSLRAGSLATGTAVAGGTRAVSTPVGVQQGDLMLLFFGAGSTMTTLTPPVGWTQAYLNNDGFRGMWLWYKVAGASEPATYDWVVGPTTSLGWRTWAIKSANYVGTYLRLVGGTYDAYTWSTNTPMYGHRLGQFGIIYSRNTVFANSLGGVDVSAVWGADLSFEELRSGYRFAPDLIFQSTDMQSGWFNVITQATGSYTESTVLTVDSPWSVQPDATSTYAIDSGSFWCWRGNASDPAWRWAKYDIARGVWEQKTSTDAAVAPTFVGAAAVVEYASNPSTFTVDVPAGVVDGDLLLVLAAVNQNAVTAVPAGWALLLDSANGGGSASRFVAYYKVASSEPANYTWGAQSGQGATFHCLAYRGTGTPVGLATAGTNNPFPTYTGSCPNIHTLPALAVSMISHRGSNTGSTDPNPPVPSTSVDTQRAVGTWSRSGDRVVGAAAGLSETPYPWTLDDGTRAGYAMGWGLILVPGTSPGMSNYGKADPSKQGGIHATTDDGNYIWLGGDAQTSLRRYSISGDSWSASAEHTPYTRPMRNIGGGMVMVKDLPGWADNGRYIFYVCPMESSNVYDANGRAYAYDTTNDLWIDLFADSLTATPPGQFCQIGSVNGRLVWNTPASRKIYAHRPDWIDAFLPDAMLNAPVRGGTTTGCSLHPITLGGEPYLYMLEHSNTQEIIPFRARLRGITWAGG